jgi:hypothetical protein
MKKLLISSIAMLTTLFITSCIYAITPDEGWMEKDGSTFLVVGQQMIPVDSGIPYHDAQYAYFHQGKLCFVAEKTKKIDWMTKQRYDLCALYDGEKIAAIKEKKGLDNPLFFKLILFLPIFCYVLFIFSPRFQKTNILP